MGLYGFTSAHVLDAVTAALVGKKLNLTLDHPAKNPTADQTDAQAVEALDQALSSSTGSTCAQAWALSRMDPEASAWIFATAYHIKVAVADYCAVLALQRELEQLQPTRHRPCRRRIWLTRRRSRTSRRPGLACASSSTPGLAATMEAYLLNDLEIAATHNDSPEVPGVACCHRLPWGARRHRHSPSSSGEHHHHRHDDADSAAHP